MFLSYICTNGRFSEFPSYIQVNGSAIYVKSVVVFTFSGACHAFYELEMIVVSMAVQHGFDFKRRCCGVRRMGKWADRCAYRSNISARFLILIRESGRIEGVGTKVL